MHNANRLARGTDKTLLFQHEEANANRWREYYRSLLNTSPTVAHKTIELLPQILVNEVPCHSITNFIYFKPLPNSPSPSPTNHRYIIPQLVSKILKSPHLLKSTPLAVLPLPCDWKMDTILLRIQSGQT